MAFLAKFSALVILITVALPLSIAPASAGQCLEDTRKVQLDGKKAVRFRNYLCRAGQSDARVSIEFHRLGDLMASALFVNALPASLQDVFGNGRLVKNAVHKEFAFLLKQFGNSVEKMQINYSINTAGTKDEAYGYDTGTAGAGIRSLQFNTNVDMPLVKEVRHINKKNTWPRGFGFSYAALNPATATPADIVRGTTVWRYLRAADLKNFARNWRNYTAMVKGDKKHPKNDFGEFYSRIPGDIKLLKYITKKKLPKGFLIITGGVPLGCGEDNPYGEFGLATRPVLLDVAVIKNRSRNAITLNNLLGVRHGDKALRLGARSKLLYRGQAAALGGPSTIEAGGSLIVPLKISFGSVESGICTARECKKAQSRIYRHIRAKRRGTRFKSGRIVKTRESFQKPKYPKNTINKKYTYGPEVALTGMVIGGERIVLKDHSANFLQLTAGAQVGSCPYLYALDPQSRRWINYGKVIHTADSKAKKTTQLIRLKGFARRFRLTEHELELSYIDRVQLVLDLLDGRKITLAPKQKLMSLTDRNVQKIYAGQTVEFEFDLPDNLTADNVKSSSLAVTGYYERYGSMIMSAK